MGIAAIGEDASIEVYSLIGADVLFISKFDDTTLHKILELLMKHKIVIIEEAVYKKLSMLLKERSHKNIFIIVPTLKKEETNRLESLNKKLSLAMGVELKWVR